MTSQSEPEAVGKARHTVRYRKRGVSPEEWSSEGVARPESYDEALRLCNTLAHFLGGGYEVAVQVESSPLGRRGRKGEPKTEAALVVGQPSGQLLGLVNLRLDGVTTHLTPAEAARLGADLAADAEKAVNLHTVARFLEGSLKMSRDEVAGWCERYHAWVNDWMGREGASPAAETAPPEKS